jgi:nucleotide-binding universal stress UspA family protein
MTENLVNHIHHAVVVGVDGSPSSWAAVHAAVWEARQRGQDLVLAHGFYERMPYQSYGWSPYVPTVEDVFAGPKAMLAETVATARQHYPDLAVHTQLLTGTGSSALVQLSQQASLVVVGSRGDGGFAGLSIGSTAAQVAAYATCPVLVIRPAVADEDVPPADSTGDGMKPGPVLVGVAGSSHDQAALRFAFEEASLRHVPLIAAHVWWYPPEVSIQPEHLSPYDQATLTDLAERVVAEALAGWSEQYPDVSVEQRTIHALNTSYALIEDSADAGLVVVGCRGRGGFTGLLLGSVSRDLVGHAQAPVAVIHDHA